jgi:hypothetical protein
MALVAAEAAETTTTWVAAAAWMAMFRLKTQAMPGSRDGRPRKQTSP